MKKILVPTDFSPTAEKAFRFALNLASRINGAVVLLHIYITIQSTFIGTEEKRQMYNAQMEKNSLKRLQRLKKKVAGLSSPIPVETVVGRSPLRDHILGYAEHHAIDLIVMGTQGASGLKKVIVGTEASRIMEESDLPVLLIPEKFEWKEPEKIIFATDLALSEINALHLAIDLAQLYKTSITIFHLFESNTTGAKQEKEMVLFEIFAGQLQKSFSHFPLQFEPVQTTNISGTMENLHKEIPYDLLVMVRRNKSFPQRLFIKSFTKSMSYITRLPLLVIPDEYRPGKDPKVPLMLNAFQNTAEL